VFRGEYGKPKFLAFYNYFANESVINAMSQPHALGLVVANHAMTGWAAVPLGQAHARPVWWIL